MSTWSLIITENEKDRCSLLGEDWGGIWGAFSSDLEWGSSLGQMHLVDTHACHHLCLLCHWHHSLLPAVSFSCSILFKDSHTRVWSLIFLYHLGAAHCFHHHDHHCHLECKYMFDLRPLDVAELLPTSERFLHCNGETTMCQSQGHNRQNASQVTPVSFSQPTFLNVAHTIWESWLEICIFHKP